MIQEKMYTEIHRLKRLGYSKSTITTQLDLDPKTVAKYYAMDEHAFRSYRQKHLYREKVFEAYEAAILEVYHANDYRPLNMTAVYDYLEEGHGALPGNEQTLRNYIQYLIQTDTLRLREPTRIYTQVPELPFGQQMQLDFGQVRCRSGFRLFIFAALLSASRYKYLTFQDHPFRTTEVIEHLLSCFEYIGGVPEELVIDQDHLLVVSENAGDIIYTTEFQYFIEEQSLRLYVCRPADPESKGKVENLIKYVKHQFFGVRDFATLADANVSVLQWLTRRANGKISQATKQIPADLIVHERPHLRSIRHSIFRKDSLIGREERTANAKAVISVEACGYQLPSKYRNTPVEIYVTPRQVFVFDRYTGEEIVEYLRSPLPGRVLCKRAFKRESETPAAALKAQVWAMFPGEQWQQFTEKNFATFPRYVRDQCLEAQRYFPSHEINPELLERALTYCLDHATVSFANLHDTYCYFRRETAEIPTPWPELAADTQPRGYRGNHAPIAVTKRNVAVYNALVSSSEEDNQ